MRPIITLTSDWRLRDPYLAMFKGELLRTLPEAQLIDITHNIDFFHIAQTAFVIKQSYRHFPEGSIHLILTNTSNSSTERPVVLHHDNHYFISNDNGIFFLMFGKNGKLSGRQATEDKETGSLTKMVALADRIAKGTLDEGTTEYTEFHRLHGPVPMNIIPSRTIEGEIIYIDAARNAITNIPTDMFKETVKGASFTAIIHAKTEWKTQKYYDTYVKDEGIYLTNNALGHIEITMYQGDVAWLASMNVGDKVSIDY